MNWRDLHRRHTARRLIAATRDYGVPCRYAIRPSQAGLDAQAWRADAFDERHEFHAARLR